MRTCDHCGEPANRKVWVSVHGDSGHYVWFCQPCLWHFMHCDLFEDWQFEF
jgi:hypothetical protein